jgi:hypothetical protein
MLLRDLRIFASGGFSEARSERLAAIGLAQGEGGAAGAVGAALADALLDLAAFHLARGLIAEGLATLEGLDDASLSADLEARRRLLGSALTVLDLRGQSGLREAIADLEAAGPDDAVAILLAHARQRAGAPDAAEALSGRAAALDALPEPIIKRVLPSLLEAAIGAEEWALAQSLAERLAARHQPGEGALPYLLGEVAQGDGDLLTAFDRFAEAAPARDVYGHRARLALVGLGLEVDALSGVEALSMLERIHALWRGDAEAARTLLQMERVAKEMDDPRTAALALGELFAQYPGSLEAEAAEERALPLVMEFYERGRSGIIALDTFMEGHREIAAAYRFFPGFATVSEGFADHMREMGATGASAEEYSLTREYLAVAADLGLHSPDPAQLDRLRLKEAELRLDGALSEAAGNLLAPPLATDDPAMQEWLALLRARYFAMTGEMLLQDSEVRLQSEEFHRLVARGHSTAGAWEQARDAYATLWRMLGADMPLSDAVGLLIAAQRSGDADLVATAEALIASHGGLAAETVTNGFASEPVALRDLRAERARSFIDRAGRVIGRAERLAVEENQLRSQE